jgi:hypothetical protein
MNAGSWLFLTPQEVFALSLPEHDIVRTAGLLKFCFFWETFALLFRNLSQTLSVNVAAASTADF